MTAPQGGFQVGAVDIEHVPRKLTMYRVTEEELFTLRGIGPTISLAFFGIMVGASFSLYAALQGSTLDRDTWHDLNALFIGSRWLAVFFAIVAVIGYFRLWRIVREIKKRRADATTT
jgi:hypothetical protein